MEMEKVVIVSLSQPRDDVQLVVFVLGGLVVEAQGVVVATDSAMEPVVSPDTDSAPLVDPSSQTSEAESVASGCGSVIVLVTFSVILP